jgi:acyl dehydratase
MSADPGGYGVLTDESFERSRARIGIPLRINPAHITEVNADASRHFCYGYGDDNPLYCDPEYGGKTRWGSLVAPPNFTYCMGESAAPELTPAQKRLLKGDPFAGLGSYQAAMEFEYYRPLLAGHRCRVIRAQVGVEDKPSRFGGRTAHVTHDFLYANGRGEIVTIQRGTWINAERHATRARAESRSESGADAGAGAGSGAGAGAGSGGTRPVSFEPYTDEQLAEIDAAYDAEDRRGARPRYFEDVDVGEEIQPRVKGPLTVTDLIVWHIGWGMQLTPPGAFGIARKVRRKAPGLYPPNARNIPDTVQRLHWDGERARELGIATNYDYGGMRETWLTHALTDWMGDDGWLFKLRCEHRGFNYVGDTTWVRGTVVDKVQAEGRNEVHLEVGCWNQRGEQTTPGRAVVLLPSRGRAVELPRPPANDLEELLAAEIARYASPSAEEG